MKLETIAKIVSGTVAGDPGLEITGVRDLSGAKAGDLSFVQSERHLPAAQASKTSALLVPPGLSVPGRSCIEVANPKFSFIVILSRFLPAPRPPWEWTRTRSWRGTSGCPRGCGSARAR